MGQLVVMGAMMKCSFGATPAALIVAPAKKVVGEMKPAATITDFAPTTNIPPFGMCSAPTNPVVATATTAAGGVLTPQTCVPVTATPWAPGSPTVLIGGTPALNNTSVCNCSWLGVITFTNAGTTKTTVP
jgi:hypothetical protein